VSAAGPDAGPAALQPGLVLLERFRLEHALGPGDLGDQWRAHDQKEGRPVLVEVLPPGPPLAPQQVKDLQETCGRITALRYDGLARVVQFGFLGLQPVVAREMIPGLSLADQAARHGPVEASVARTWLAPLAAALDRAHEGGVVHGHVRAEAVRFRSDGAPVLTGLELSPFHPAPPGAPRSPEQRLGRTPTPESDRWALAALATRLVGDRDPVLAARLEAAMSDQPGQRPRSAAGVVDLLATPAAAPPGIGGGVAMALAGLGILVAVPLVLLTPGEAPPAAPTTSAPGLVPAGIPGLPPEQPPRLELGAGAPELADPRTAVGRFTARALGRETRARTGFVVNVDGRAGVVLTAHQTFGVAGGLPRPLTSADLPRRVRGQRLEVRGKSFQLGKPLVLHGAGAVASFTKPSHDVAGFLVDRPRAGFTLRQERLVRDEPLVVLSWTGELYRAVAEPQVTGARTYRFLRKVPPGSAVGAPVLDRKKRVVGIHVATVPRPGGRVAGICTASDLVASRIRRALAPLQARAAQLAGL
jgi:hypothetical protein